MGLGESFAVVSLACDWADNPTKPTQIRTLLRTNCPKKDRMRTGYIRSIGICTVKFGDMVPMTAKSTGREHGGWRVGIVVCLGLT